VQYTQSLNPRKYLFPGQQCRETCVQVSESAMREAVGQAPLDKALAFDPSITDRAKVLLQRTLDNYDMGVNIISGQIGDVIVPSRCKMHSATHQADKDRQRYQQDAETIATMWCRVRAAKRPQKSLDAERTACRCWPWRQGETSRFIRS